MVGKLATKAAMLLMGKHKGGLHAVSGYRRSRDRDQRSQGAAEPSQGRKKVYRHFTGYPGGLVEKSFKRVRAERPARIIEDAIFGMLPKTKLGKQMYRKLKVYAGDKHPHAAQKPSALALKISEGRIS